MRTLALLLLAAAAARAEPPAFDPGRLPLGRTEWFGVYLQGRKGGYASSLVRRAGDAYVEEFVLHVEVEALGKATVLEISQVQRFDAANLAFVGGRLEFRQGPAANAVRIEPDGEGLKVVVEAAGEKVERSLKRPAFTLADYMGYRAWVRTGPALGATLETPAFDLMSQREGTDTYTVDRVVTTTVEGVEVTYYEVSHVSSVYGPSGTLRLTRDGDLASMVVGGMFEMRREPEEIAKRVEKGGDLFLQQVAKLDKPLGEARNVTALVLRLRGEGAAHVVPGPRQAVEQREDGTAVVRLGAKHAAPVAATEEEIREALEPERDLPAGDTRLADLLQRALGDAKTDRAKVERLVPFVATHVEDALRLEPVALLELLKDPRGDCSEHAALFTALARAAGIPARTVTGVAYLGDRIQALGGHAWNEVVLDGVWVPVDPSWNETEIDAARIRIGSGLKGLVQAAWAFGRIECEVLELEVRGGVPAAPQAR